MSSAIRHDDTSRVTDGQKKCVVISAEMRLPGMEESRIEGVLFKRDGTGLYSCSLWNDKPTGRNNATPRRLSRAGHNETKAQSEALFLCVTHWFLSYRASVSDTPYLVGCNGVRRLGIISLVTSNVSSET